MKVLTISDLHGRDVWKEVDVRAYDQIIFLGDYTDSYYFDDLTIYTNLTEIIGLKQREPTRVTLLLGNHDAQYRYYPDYSCSGFRPKAQPALTALFDEHRSLFQISHQIGDYLFTHAGVTTSWLKEFVALTERTWSSLPAGFDLAGLLNDAEPHRGPLRDLLLAAGPVRGGNALFGGPVWADRSETRTDYLKGYHQVVGHTPISEFTTMSNSEGSITYTDVLQTKTAFYEVTIAD